ncbi:MAG TPA: hypothetical protein P5075_08290 [Eubacteriales bacterium]|nr:hypothetical protein [Eubacteriales bacterium]
MKRVSAKGANTIETDFLTIKGNMMKWSDTIIQISNISIISTVHVAAKRFPFLSFVFILIGAIILKLGVTDIVSVEFYGVSLLGGIALIVAALAWMLLWVDRKQRADEMQQLSILMNSGTVYSIVFQNKKFLAEVMKRFSEILSTPAHTGDLTINIKNNTFSGQAQAIGSVKES